MASAMTSATTGSVTVVVAAVVFLSQNSAMVASTSGGVTSSVPIATLSRTGMVSRTLGQVTASAPAVQMRVPMRAQTSGAVTLTSTPQTLIALRLDPVTATITGTNRKALMRRTSAAGLTVFDAARELYNLWDIEITDPRKIDFARARVLGYINQTVQMIHSRAHKLDYFNKKPYTAIVVGGTNSIALPDTIQVVHGECRLSTNNKPLSLLASLGQLEQYTAIVHGETAAPSTPRAYYIDSRHQSGSDNTLLTIYVAPTPVDNTTIKFEASAEPPRYDAVDILQATGLEIPHKFAESLFWPILRYYGVQDSNYTGSPAQRQDVTLKHASALVALGLFAPKPTKPKIEEQEAPEQ